MTAIENDVHRIDPLGPDDILHYKELACEIYQLFSDEHTLRFLPHKKLSSLTAARNWLSAAFLNFHSGRNQVYLIRAKTNRALLGVIDLIPPAVAKEHYHLPYYPFFIEFYLKGTATGKALMSTLLPQVVGHLQSKGILELAAVANRHNIAAGKVLQRSGFIPEGPFDRYQDIYRCSA
ncbi:GNAT family N-acetyltransferase [Mucilaginibacter pedocola]|uniref:N-acetyltransferase domain-containing protein n=1 Tax=Mucilaginibacter pedocola TaxID=1792845 RepID=A0A1S9PKL0_9SPHI|nr:GNAT family N-acetyltransferase [Mucilaginibacter pedocola]OOQ61502.1 hypothetical protein BC343_00010 [Mucilaginibacter pedocola]